jgi:hypothetical protein
MNENIAQLIRVSSRKYSKNKQFWVEYEVNDTYKDRG